MKTQNLISLTSLIETPFISVSFGGETFGFTDKIKTSTGARDIDFCKSLTVQKLASGSVNKYSLNMDYVIRPGTDPNYVDRILSKDLSRKILFSYGDLSQPNFSYKEEQAIITNVKPSVDVRNAKISYTVEATSSVKLSYAVKRSYAARTDQPSKVIFEILYVETENGLLSLFPGMADRKKVEDMGWIANNDIPVKIEAKTNISPYEYLCYLVSLMQSNTQSFYGIVIHDIDNIENGHWFEVINSSLRPAKYVLDIDIGYPGSLPIFNFSVNEDTSFALITEYLSTIEQEKIININKLGEVETTNDPSFVVRNGHIDSQLKSWWKNMTSFPISASLTTRGLIIPAILCETIHINVLFFGRLYHYTGDYMVVGQTDSISSAGFRSTLNLIRVGGEDI